MIRHFLAALLCLTCLSFAEEPKPLEDGLELTFAATLEGDGLMIKGVPVKVAKEKLEGGITMEEEEIKGPTKSFNFKPVAKKEFGRALGVLNSLDMEAVKSIMESEKTAAVNVAVTVHTYKGKSTALLWGFEVYSDNNSIEACYPKNAPSEKLEAVVNEGKLEFLECERLKGKTISVVPNKQLEEIEAKWDPAKHEKIKLKAYYLESDNTLHIVIEKGYTLITLPKN